MCGRYVVQSRNMIILEGNLTSERYIELIRTNILDSLSEEPLDALRQLWWQQDGASLHSERGVTNLLNVLFPNKWIGKGGTLAS